MIRIWESFIRVLQLPKTGGRETTPGTKPFSKEALQPHPSRQDGAETLPGAPAVPPGSITAGQGERDGKSSPSCSHPHTIQQLSIFPARLCFGTAGSGWPWEGFEPSWLKFNFSPAVPSCPFFSHVYPSPDSSQLTPSLLPCQPGEG